MEGLEGFVDVTEYTKSCVYILMDGTEIVYIGQSVCGLERIADHKRRNLKFDRVMHLSVPTGELDDVERLYISIYRPKYNSHLRFYGYMNDASNVRRMKALRQKSYRVDGKYEVPEFVPSPIPMKRRG